ncbi:hypothetical protein [Teichococcus wenyumeiae]|uniref:hypothetical protein n=1 Tax=Teichococcus wenyumeiae TaxID=2478470 RepID=UPI0011C43353|nr:hypothetical protein [Pseudoroseomonas wenyumeiae]
MRCRFNIGSKKANLIVEGIPIRLVDTDSWFRISESRRDKAVAKKPKPSGPLSELSLEILAILKNEFISKKRTTSELLDGYVGVSMEELQDEFLSDGRISRVDYDLALKSLEDRGLVGTGPMKMYDNEPGSSVFILSLFSLREYIYLKEEGYNIVSEDKKKSVKSDPAPRQNVTITGGHFYQSPIGVGKKVSQTLNFDVNDQNDTVNYLVELLSSEGVSVDAAMKSQVVDMVSKASSGDMASAKPIYQRIFGAISGPAKEVAAGVLTAIVTSSLGI